eukprot:COSAG02_NODE_29_length_51136_cov_346.293317_7_plen_51_part_00
MAKEKKEKKEKKVRGAMWVWVIGSAVGLLATHSWRRAGVTGGVLYASLRR